MKRIYLSPPSLNGRERALLLDAIDSNWVTTLGPHVDAFELEICHKIGVGFAAALSSGTSALHLALVLLGVEPGDEVITSTLTFAASANAIIYCGARPVFIDSDRETWNLDPTLLEEELASCQRRGRLPKAAVVVDIYGQCASYGPILATCDRYGIPVVEDAAEALGASYDGRSAGTFGAMGVLSFNGNKIITTSGGGMLVSGQKRYIDRARFLATQARDPFPYYHHTNIGYNYRLSNLLAAVGRGQLETLDEKIERKRAINDAYRVRLRDIPGIEFMPEAPHARSTFWLTCILVDPALFGATADDIRLKLDAHNVEARPVWKPMHLQPVFRDCRVRGGAVTEDLFSRGLCLPSGCGLEDVDVDFVSDLICEVYHAQSKHQREPGDIKAQRGSLADAMPTQRGSS